MCRHPTAGAPGGWRAGRYGQPRKTPKFGSLEDIFDHTSHPYTKALLRSVPVLGLGDDQKLETIPGVTPNPADLKEGCEFADRCSECMEKCRKGKIPAFEVSPGHKVRCLKFDSYPEVK